MFNALRSQYRFTRSVLVITFAALVLLSFASRALAEKTEVSLAKQFGLTFFPLMVMEHLKLIEKNAQMEGRGNVTVKWVTLGGGASANEMLLSGSLDFVSGGAAPLITIWSKTKGSIDVKGVASLNAMPWILTTINPNVKTLKDFTDKDKIAMPAAKVSVHAITLQMAAAKVFGESSYEKLDRITVSMRNPDALVAMLAGKGEITSHFSGPPYPQLELQDPKVRVVLSSDDVLGGPGVLSALYTTSKFRSENPRLYKVVLRALKEAQDIINSDKRRAAELYVQLEKSKQPIDLFYQIISDSKTHFSPVPMGMMKIAEFMHKTGQIKIQPSSWKEMFFPEIHDLPGS